MAVLPNLEPPAGIAAEIFGGCGHQALRRIDKRRA
jgi:hypothetical protein